MGRKANADTGDLKLTGVPRDLKNMLINISKNLGVDISPMLKPLIRKYVDEQPEHLKRPFNPE
jgi:hypothetical protein